MYPANTKLSSVKSRLRIIVFGALLTLLFTSCGAPFGAEQSSSTPSQQCGTLTDQQALENMGRRYHPTHGTETQAKALLGIHLKCPKYSYQNPS